MAAYTELEPKIESLISDFNYRLLVGDGLAEGKLSFFNSNKEKVIEKEKSNNACTLKDLAKNFFDVVTAFKNDYESLNKLNLSQSEVLLDFTDGDVEKELVIKLKSLKPEFMTKRDKCGDVITDAKVFLYREVEGSMVNYYAYLDYGFGYYHLIPNHTENFDIDEKVIKSYFDLLVRHKEAMLYFEKSKEVTNHLYCDINGVRILFQFYGNLFEGFEKCFLQFGTKKTVGMVVGVMFYFEPEFFVNINPRSLSNDNPWEDHTFIALKDGCVENEDVEAVINKVLNDTFVKKDIFKH